MVSFENREIVILLLFVDFLFIKFKTQM